MVCTSSARTSGGSSRGCSRSRPRSRHGGIVRDRAAARASAARGRRATCRHEVNVCSFRYRFFSASSSRTRAGKFPAIFIGGDFGFRPGSISVRVLIRVRAKTARARAPPTAVLDVHGLTTRAPAIGRARAPAGAGEALPPGELYGLVSGTTRTPAPPAAATAHNHWCRGSLSDVGPMWGR